MKTFKITNIEMGETITLTDKWTVNKHIIHVVSKDTRFKVEELTTS